MRSNRAMTAALFTIAGTGIARLVLNERQHLDRTVLESARIHQRLLASQVERPGLREIWGSLTPLDPRERRLHVHRNAMSFENTDPWCSQTTWHPSRSAALYLPDAVRRETLI